MIKNTKFVGSFTRQDQCPESEMPEFAFIGRSNVGKSSLINMLCNKKGLAKISSTPGKTQAINIFIIDEKWQIADLPGYGYAKVSKVQRSDWQKMIKYYCNERKNLACLFVLIDSNIPPQKLDIDFVNTLGEWQIPFAMIFTKIDRMRQQDVARNKDQFLKELSASWAELPVWFLSSAEKGSGRDAIMQYIYSIIES